MKLRELINRLEELSNDGKNNDEEIIVRDCDTHIEYDVLRVMCNIYDNVNYKFEIEVL